MLVKKTNLVALDLNVYVDGLVAILSDSTKFIEFSPPNRGCGFFLTKNCNCE